MSSEFNSFFIQNLGERFDKAIAWWLCHVRRPLVNSLVGILSTYVVCIRRIFLRPLKGNASIFCILRGGEVNGLQTVQKLTYLVSSILTGIACSYTQYNDIFIQSYVMIMLMD